MGVQGLKKLFRMVALERELPDDDALRPTDCQITEEEFRKILKVEKVQAYFGALGVEVNHAQGLFRLLDADGTGAVNIEEFVIGCLRLRGEATAVDCATLMYEN